MKYALMTTILFATLGGSAAVASEDCNVPMAEWQPREALQKKLEDDGWKVNRIKTDGGCYEVGANDDKGRRVHATYDPKTFEVVKREREEGDED